MKSLVREIRLLPVVLLATISLFSLKIFGLALDGGYVLKDTEPPKVERIVVDRSSDPRNKAGPPSQDADAGRSRQSWAQEMFNFPDSSGAPRPLDPERRVDLNADTALVTGAVAEKKPEQKDDKPGPAAPPPAAAGTSIPVEGVRQSAGERAILERLGERRQELDARSRELEIRENLLKSTERRLEDRTNELRSLETRINGASAKKDEQQAAQLKGLVIMYENMKAKDAAKIFDRLEMRVLIEVVSQINPRRMADIMAQMNPEAAEKLTVELANRATTAQKTSSGGDLPKIEGRPPAP